MISSHKVDNFIQERLDALNTIDRRIVDLLEGVSKVFETFSEPKPKDINSLKERVESQARNIYDCISDIAIDLRKEVKTMDDNIGVYNKNKDNVMLLPIAVGQKNTSVGLKKLDEQLEVMDRLVGPVEVPPESESESEDDPGSEAESQIEDPIKKTASEKDIIKEEPESANPFQTETEVKTESGNNDSAGDAMKDENDSKSQIKAETTTESEVNAVKTEESKQDNDKMEIENTDIKPLEGLSESTTEKPKEIIDLDEEDGLMDLDKTEPPFPDVIDLDDLSPSGDFLMKD